MPKNKKVLRDLLGGISMSEALEEFAGNASSFSETFLMSEPLRTFFSNASAIKALVSLALTSVEKKKEAADEKLRNYERRRDNAVETMNRSKVNLEEMIKTRKLFERGVAKGRDEGNEEMVEAFEHSVTGMDGIITRVKELIAEAEKSVGEFDELSGFVSVDVNGYIQQREILMPMVFVYLVTIWDAFILDTARKILRIHPEKITVSDAKDAKDAKVEVKKAFLWGLQSIEEVRNWLIEEVVRDLDHKRKKLVECFANHWGIDWRKSGIPIDEVVEIRARRDIWVHNKGMVNKQYVDMVGEDDALEEGQVAQIDAEYLDACLEKLSGLAIYIHRVAHEKHYAKVGE